MSFYVQGKYMDIEFDFKGDPVGGVITNCTCLHKKTNNKLVLILWQFIFPSFFFIPSTLCDVQTFSKRLVTNLVE